MSEPDAADARRIVVGVLGKEPVDVVRFATGTHHFVFDVTLADHTSVVARLTKSSERAAMAGALHLSRLLRPLRVPLPAVLAAGIDAPHPWLLLERLPGQDLGRVIAGLSSSALDGIAARVAEAQALTGGTGASGAYGFAVRPEDAPHPTWSAVVHAHIERSRGRIDSAGLFDAEPAAILKRAVASQRTALDAIPPTPFLHDTTTKNVIVTDGGAFSGIVDVDDLCFGDPRYAPALTHASLLARGLPTDYVEAWRSHAGWALDSLFRLYVAAFLLDFMSEHGQTFNGNQSPSSAREREYLSMLFAEAAAQLPR